MDDSCGEWVESIGVASGCIVSRRQVWLVGGIYGCGYQEVGVVKMCSVTSGRCCKEVYRFLHIIYPNSTCISSFLQLHLYFFVHI